MYCGNLFINTTSRIMGFHIFISVARYTQKKLQGELHDKAMTDRNFSNPCFKTTVRKNDTVDSK